MRNRKPLTTRTADESALNGANIGLFVFVALAIWLLLFQSNLFT